MPDRYLKDSLEFILQAIGLIRQRMEAIRTPSDFVGSASGILLMDGISMRLQAISEKVKRIENKSPGIFMTVGIDPQPIIRFRDFISHHYDEVDYEVIYDVRRNYLPILEEKVRELLSGSF